VGVPGSACQDYRTNSGHQKTPWAFRARRARITERTPAARGDRRTWRPPRPYRERGGTKPSEDYHGDLRLGKAGLTRRTAGSRRGCEELAARDPWGWSIVKPTGIWRFLGDTSAAEKESRRCLKHPERFSVLNREHCRQLLEYTAGNLTLAEFEKTLNNSPVEQCVGHFNIALVLLSQQDRDGAGRYFQKCIASGAPTFVAYDLALIFRERLERDPRWPRTIPVKE
jgi:hypothetical protein